VGIIQKMIQVILKETKTLVWPEIQRYLKDPIYPPQFRVPQKYQSDLTYFWKTVREYPRRRGKYLRPTLVLLTCEAMGKNIMEAIKTAAAMQVSEDWLLIHDDFEDKSLIRRGKPTLHEIYGNELAVNAGDALQIIMWKIVNDIGSKKIADEFYRMLLRTTVGQGIEQRWSNNRKTLSDDDYFLIADSKSAYYSIAGPMRLGAILSGATASQIDKITEFGRHLGRCFQLIDDILDIKQDKEEGKITLAILRGAKYAKKLAVKEKESARRIFDQDLEFLAKEPARTKLKEIMEFILERDC
jgi:geranylgeranyl pyrophosphate synthase